MDGGKAPAYSSSSGIGCSTILPERSHVLFIDGDAVSRKIVESMLLECNNQVTACSMGMEALAILRDRRGEFDIVMSDVHLLDVNVLEFLQCLVVELQLPVIMILDEYNEEVKTMIMNHGAHGIMVRPVTKDAIMNVRKYLASRKQNEINRSGISQLIIAEEDRTRDSEEGSRHQNAVNSANDAPSTSKGGSPNPSPSTSKGGSPNSNSNPSPNPNNAERKKKKREGEQREPGKSPAAAAVKKPRLVWEPFISKRFIEVVNELGVENAVPKKILERMNIPGLTRDHVASHLQKFRLQLRMEAKNQKKANKNSTAAPGLQSSCNIRSRHPANILSNQNPVHSGVMSTQVSKANAQIANVSNINQPSMQPTYSNQIIYHSGNSNSLRPMQLERPHCEHPSENTVLRLNGSGATNNLPNPQQTIYSRHDTSVQPNDQVAYSNYLNQQQQRQQQMLLARQPNHAHIDVGANDPRVLSVMANNITPNNATNHVARGDGTNFTMDRSTVVGAPPVLYADSSKQSYTELPAGFSSHANNIHAFVREEPPITTNHFGATSNAASLQSGRVMNDYLCYDPSLIRSELSLMQSELSLMGGLSNIHFSSSSFCHSDQEENRLVTDNINAEHNRIEYVEQDGDILSSVSKIQ